MLGVVYLLLGLVCLRVVWPMGRFAMVSAGGEGGVVLMFACLIGAGGLALIRMGVTALGY